MLQQVIDFLYDQFISLKQKLEAVVFTVFDMLKDFFFFIIDSVFSFVVFLLNSITIPLTWSPAQYISALPPEVSNMLGLIGLQEAFSIIVAAILIRFTMQLIPFVRLGS